MPRFSVIYVKRTEKTPKNTVITFTFPDGQEVNYESENIILEEFTNQYPSEGKVPAILSQISDSLLFGEDIFALIISLIVLSDNWKRIFYL